VPHHQDRAAAAVAKATIKMKQRGRLTQASNFYAFTGLDFAAPARFYIPSRNSTHDNIKGLLQTVIEGLASKEVYTPRHNRSG
jgi:hypothetical protein